MIQGLCGFLFSFPVSKMWYLSHGNLYQDYECSLQMLEGGILVTEAINVTNGQYAIQ